MAVPGGWAVAPTSTPHTRKAGDPRNARRFVLFGGSEAQDRTQRQRVEEMAAQLTDYRPVSLRRVRYGDARDAVDWVFRFTFDGHDIYAHGRYWRIDGREYAVYARGPARQLTATEATFDALTRTARPR